MTAATGPIAQEYEITDKPVLPLGAGLFGHQDTLACADVVAGCVKPGVSGNANLIPLGTFLDETDNTAGGAAVGVVVQLDRPVKITYWANDTVSAITSVFQTAYILDNQTVTAAPSGNSKAGVVWKIDAIKGIGVVTPAY